jgi:hypothetical protein
MVLIRDDVDDGIFGQPAALPIGPAIRLEVAM